MRFLVCIMICGCWFCVLYRTVAVTNLSRTIIYDILLLCCFDIVCFLKVWRSFEGLKFNLICKECRN